MTFRYGLTLPALGAHKIRRFDVWARENMPDLAYSLPPQAPIKSETLTVRLASTEAVARVRGAFPTTLP